MRLLAKTSSCLWAIFGSCLFLLAISYFVELVLNVKPCLLCLLQRYMFILIALISLAALLARVKAWGVYVSATILTLCSIVGAALAGRQLYLQSLPDSLHRACLPDMQYLVHAVGIFKALQMMVAGSSDCSLVHWQFLGLSMAAWALIWFVILALVALRIFFANRSSS
mgnify:CR=1 FL=1